MAFGFAQISRDATDKAEAIEAARRVHAILELTSDIDPLSAEGVVPEAPQATAGRSGDAGGPPGEVGVARSGDPVPGSCIFPRGVNISKNSVEVGSGSPTGPPVRSITVSLSAPGTGGLADPEGPPPDERRSPASVGM